MQQRNAVVDALLTLILPPYLIYWLYVNAEMMRKRGQQIPSMLKFLLAPFLLLLLTFFAQFFVQFLLVRSVSGPDMVSDPNPTINIFFAVLSLAGVAAVVILPILYFYRFSVAASNVTKGQASVAANFLLLFLLTPIGVFFIQEKLNNAPRAKAKTTKAASPKSPTS